MRENIFNDCGGLGAREVDPAVEFGVAPRSPATADLFKRDRFGGLGGDEEDLTRTAEIPLKFLEKGSTFKRDRFGGLGGDEDTACPDDEVDDEDDGQFRKSFRRFQVGDKVLLKHCDTCDPKEATITSLRTTAGGQYYLKAEHRGGETIGVFRHSELQLA